MGRQNSHYQIEKFIDEFNRSVYHPILNRDIGQPKLHEHTALFLLLPKLNGEQWTSQAQIAAIAVGAVYTAFDAHDAVDIYDVTTTNQQLKVLSGDYLSGVYYQLLAAIPDFEFINVLSNTIGRINELKTELYTNIEMKTSDRIEAIQSIQAECIIQFFKSFGYGNYIPLVKAALPLIALKNQMKVDALGGWSLKSEFSTEALKQLRIDLEKALKEVDFLAPYILEEISEMTMPIFDKTI